MENPFTYFAIGNLLVIDLIAAGTNALNGALLARNPPTTAATTGRSSAYCCWRSSAVSGGRFARRHARTGPRRVV